MQPQKNWARLTSEVDIRNNTVAIIKEVPGSYSVSIDGLTRKFTVLAPLWLSQYWWTIVTGTIVAGILVYFPWWRRRAKT